VSAFFVASTRFSSRIPSNARLLSAIGGEVCRLELPIIGGRLVALIDIDGTAPLPPGRLDELVTAIHNAESEDECDWAEWKSALDLSSKHGAFQISRAILGFANRNPATSTQPFGGTAYVVVGVEPGNIDGVLPIDGAQLQSKVARYLGSPNPFWRHHYVRPVEASDKTVLVVEVPPPKPGDRPYPLANTYEPDKATAQGAKEKSGGQSGTLFTRRGSKTERANYDEFIMLIDRALQGFGKGINDLGIVVNAMATPDFRTLDVSEAAVDWWLQQRRQALLEKTKDASRRQLGMTWGWSDSNIRDFTNAVDYYLGICRPAAEGILVATFLYQGFNGITIFIDNPTDEHLPDVQVVLSLPGSCSVIDRSRLNLVAW
jgi:Schlafen, AlbA_2